jgi:hypothetical protein
MKIGKITVILIFTLSSALYGDNKHEADFEQFLWDHPETVVVSEADKAFTSEAYNHAKNQSVFMMARFDNGWVLMMSYFGFKAGIVNNWGIYVSLSDPEGNGYFTKQKLKTKDIVFADDAFFITDGINTIEGEGNSFRVTMDTDEFSCSLVYNNIIPPWKPGDGYDYYDKERSTFDKRAVVSPWADVSGSFSFQNIEQNNLTGQGFAEKQLTVNPFTKLNETTYTMRLFSDPETPKEDRWHLGILENYLHEDYGGDRQPRLTFAHNDDWVFTSRDYDIHPYDYKTHEDLPYTYPSKVRVFCSHDGYTLDGTYISTKLFNYTDIVDELPPFFRSFILLFIQRPVYFRCLGEFMGIVTYPDGTTEYLHLLGPYEYIVVK